MRADHLRRVVRGGDRDQEDGRTGQVWLPPWFVTLPVAMKGLHVHDGPVAHSRRSGGRVWGRGGE
ncbi:hypothetical protein ACIBLA_28520 [Streptomyces sp. NPDC050433]|uniref:hypothetical protein n=1 Tax=unclassified Streptomyces TaxID=2593676 RepID=UPI003413F175